MPLPTVARPLRTRRQRFPAVSGRVALIGRHFGQVTVRVVYVLDLTRCCTVLLFRAYSDRNVPTNRFVSVEER
jgi:hypothetical protein